VHGSVERPAAVARAASSAIPAPLPHGVTDPLVSVIVTAHDYGEFIADCLRSVRGQTYERFECIVVDDCSTDDTPAVVSTLLREWQDPRFRYTRLPQNVGQLGAQLHGFGESAGEFVVFLDADDLLFPPFLERHLFVHHNIETAVAFTSSNQWTISSDGQVLAKSHTDFVSRVWNTEGIDLRVKASDDKQRRAPARGILFPFWHDKSEPSTWVWGTQSTMMFRRALLAMILPTSLGNVESFRICADFYLVRFGQLIGGSYVFREALGCYRRHGGNNFSKNGLIAARMQTGDMRSHPSAAAYRRLALLVLSERKADFIPVLGAARYYDLARYFKSWTTGVAGPKQFHRRAIRSLLLRLLGEDAYVRMRLSLGRFIG
jgi:glycosyltransferase involved in cell wall biosynthesis